MRPILSFRYNPNGNNDISSKDILLSFDNAFNLNRIGTSHQVEGGPFIKCRFRIQTADYKGNYFDFKLGNGTVNQRRMLIFPAKSKLNKTRSDMLLKNSLMLKE